MLGHNVPALNFLREGLNYGMLVDKLTCLPIYKPRSTLTNIANILGQPDWDPSGHKPLDDENVELSHTTTEHLRRVFCPPSKGVPKPRPFHLMHFIITWAPSLKKI